MPHPCTLVRNSWRVRIWSHGRTGNLLKLTQVDPPPTVILGAAAQAAAEGGRASGYAFPAVVIATVFAGLILAWSQQPVGVQSAILSLGWPLLYLITVTQTMFMIRKVLRR